VVDWAVLALSRSLYRGNLNRRANWLLAPLHLSTPSSAAQRNPLGVWPICAADSGCWGNTFWEFRFDCMRPDIEKSSTITYFCASIPFNRRSIALGGQPKSLYTRLSHPTAARMEYDRLSRNPLASAACSQEVSEVAAPAHFWHLHSALHLLTLHLLRTPPAHHCRNGNRMCAVNFSFPEGSEYGIRIVQSQWIAIRPVYLRTRAAETARHPIHSIHEITVNEPCAPCPAT
jgi:hypothetical protein